MNIHITRNYIENLREKSQLNWDIYAAKSRKTLLLFIIIGIVCTVIGLLIPAKDPQIFKIIFLGLGISQLYFAIVIFIEHRDKKNDFFLEVFQIAKENEIKNPIIEYLLSDIKIIVKTEGEYSETYFYKYKYFKSYKNFILISTQKNDSGVAINKNDLTNAELDELTILINSRLTLKK
jgi:hypothetical protein